MPRTPGHALRKKIVSVFKSIYNGTNYYLKILYHLCLSLSYLSNNSSTCSSKLHSGFVAAPQQQPPPPQEQRNHQKLCVSAASIQFSTRIVLQNMTVQALVTGDSNCDSYSKCLIANNNSIKTYPPPPIHRHHQR